MNRQFKVVRTYAVLLLLICSAWKFSYAADVGQWKTFTAKRQVRDAAFDRAHSIIWGATSGGLFSYRSSDGSFTEITTSEGLQTNDLTAIALEQSRIVWTGASNGGIHRYDPQTNSVQYISDIASRTEPSRQINRLTVSGDTLFILSDIGLSLYSLSQSEFITSFTRFGPVANPIVGTVTALTFYHGAYWVGTRSGVATTSQSNPNPASPASWQLYNTSSGLPANFINAMTLLGDTLFAATSAGLAWFSNGTAQWNVVSGTSGIGILDATPSDDGNTLYIIGDNSQLYVLDRNMQLNSVYQFSATLTRIPAQSIVATNGAGIYMGQASSWKSILPPGPPSNKFISLGVDNRSVLWAATGAANGEGFMRFDGTNWKSYAMASYPILGTDNYYKVSIGTGNAAWIGSWGNGIVLMNGNGTIAKKFDISNGMPTTVKGALFPVVGGVATDASGVAWIVDRTPPADTTVVTFNPADSSLHYIRGLTTDNTIALTDVVIDQFGTKWFTNSGRFEPLLPVGLFFYNEQFSIQGVPAGSWGELTTNDGLPSNKVTALVLDQDGALWVGSDQGVTIILDPSQPRGSFASYHPPITDQYVQAIVVDPLNNKWVATRQGVFVLSSDGTTILEHYTAEGTNGKLINDDVAALALDTKTGRMFFGTENGLSSLTTAAVAPQPSFSSKLTFAPNPFYLPSQTSLQIDGLVANSSVKILAIDGSLVREIQTPGGRLGFWDGRDERGNLVASSIYIVVAYSDDGSQVATGKIAVIRR